MLSERQLAIFNLIVEIYNQEGSPVGSKRILEEGTLDFSSATIRNDMSKLEQEGYLEKTHTSSGRVPTEKGYRFYVDQMVEAKEASDSLPDLETLLLENFAPSIQKLDDVINFSSEIISHLTNYAAIVLGPESENQKLVGFKVVQLSDQALICILVTDTGNVESLAFEMPDDIPIEGVRESVAIIEAEIQGLTLLEAVAKLQNDLPGILAQHIRHSNEALILQFTQAIQKSFSESFASIRGQMNLLDFLEDRSADHIRSFMQAVEDQKQWYEKLSDRNQDLEILIGHELDNELFSNFSLISVAYQVGDHGDGYIALLGPQNMAYDKNIQLLQDFSLLLPRMIEDLYNED